MRRHDLTAMLRALACVALCALAPPALGRLTLMHGFVDYTSALLWVQAEHDGAVAVTWRGRDGLAAYEANKQSLLDIVASHDGQVTPGTVQVFDMEVVRDTKDTTFKFSLGAEYRNAALGLNAATRLRHVDGFQVNSGVYFGQIPGYSVVDATVGYRIPGIEGLDLTLTAQNLLTFVEGGEMNPFEQRHHEFLGVPDLGMLVLLRASYEFR